MSLREKYNRCTEKLNTDLDTITQAFINIYGSEHTDYIIDRFNNLNIIWYDDEMQTFDDIRNVIVTSLPDEIVDEYLKKFKEKCFSQSAYIDEANLLVLPLSYNLTHIIHEMNHMISSHILSKKPLRIISGLCVTIEKNGGVVSNDSDLNELINQKITIDTLQELKRLRMKVIVTPSWQEKLFPLIDTFYETFKEEVKKVYVTGNLLSFIRNVGEENYINFTQTIFLKCFKARGKIAKEEHEIISQSDINQIESKVYTMKDFNEKQNIENPQKY